MKKITFLFIAMCLLWSVSLTAQTSVKGLVVYIDFSDKPATATLSQATNYFNGGPSFSDGAINRSVRQYWLEQTANEYDITHEVIKWRAPNTHAYYMDLDYNIGKQELFAGALNYVKSLHPDAAWWNQLDLVDHDVIPTGIPEGNFLSIQLMISQWGESLLLGHFTHGFAWTAPNGKKTNKVTTFALHQDGFPPPGNLAIVCHEMGHSVFEFPDLRDGNGGSKGIGFYGIMKQTTQEMPPVVAGLKEKMGWGSYTDISGTQTITLPFDNGQFARYVNPNNPRELFVIEARAKSTKGNDRLEADGLLIWHVDHDGDNKYEQMTASEHYMHALEQADGLFELENNVNNGNAGDIYVPGKSFTNTTTPNSKWWDGSSSGLSITNIQISGSQITFTASDGSATPCDPSTLTPYFQINSGSWQQGTTVSVDEGDDIRFGPQPTSGTWSWSGPNGYSSSAREATVSNVTTSDAGNYVATYTNDCGAESSVTFSVSVAGSGGGGTVTVSKRIASGSDDAEQAESGGAVSLTSTDIELVRDGGGDQTVGLRFTNLGIPQGATIVSANIQFTVDEINTTGTSLTIKGHDTDNSSTFTTSSYNISNRSTTSASVSWSPSAWNTVGAAGSDQKTPDISSVIQEIVNRSGFGTSSAISIIITGSGERTAESYDGSSSNAAELTVVYSDDGGTSCTDPSVYISPSSPTIDEGQSVTLTAYGADTYSWSTGSTSSSITVSPSSTTTYSVTGTVSGGCSDNASATVTVIPAGGGGGTVTVSKRIATGNDDVEQEPTGFVDVNSSDIEMVNNTGIDQIVGLRFVDLNIPQGATITSASIQFTADEVKTGTTNLTIKGHDTDNSAAFTTASFDVSSRTTTSASVSWSPAAWNTVGEAGSDQETPDISSIIQEIVNRSGYSSSSAISIIITGTGVRTAESYEASSSQAALLTVVYDDGGTTPPPSSYCTAGATSDSYEYISNVQLGSINNSSSHVSGRYQDFTSLSTNAEAGSSVSFSVSITNPYSGDQVLIWADWNQDGDFDDSGELVHTSATSSSTPKTGSFTVPSGANLGSTRLRIRLYDTDYNTGSPCGTTTYGEVEDYTINVESLKSLEIIDNGLSNDLKLIAYPNPTPDGAFTIKVNNIPADEKVSCKIYSMLGELIYSIRETANPIEILEGTIKGNGIYLIVVDAQTETFKAKIAVN